MQEQETKILVVEDEALILLHIKALLMVNDCESVIETAYSKKEAIEKAQSFLPDLIFMDINLEYEKAGIDASREIRKIMDAPIIFTTATPECITESISKELFPCGIIPKPINPKILKPIMQLVLTKKYKRGN
jgi:CheY-like chemotaxis protein